MTYSEAIQFLYSLRWFGAKFGLQNTFRLAAAAGNPQNQLRFIHVAGTNGKGSTCAMLESIYRQAGLKVGLFTSPHLVSFRERIQINRQLIASEEVSRLVGEMKPLLSQFGAEEHPTFFEVVTVIALRYFLAQSCDLVIWETGLGGRLDATNIVTPLASVITNIQYDHQNWLGETLESIASEKAGIIKPGIAVITGAEAPEALAVIRAAAAKNAATLSIVDSSATQEQLLKQVHLPLAGEHQQMNAAVAIATVRALNSKYVVNEECIRQGLERVRWPGRLQIVGDDSGRRIVLDGAHNTGGAKMLRAALSQLFQDTSRTLVLGILKDKDWLEMCEILAPAAHRLLLVPVQSERTASPDELSHACSRINPSASVEACGSLSEALHRAKEDRFVIVAGSLYLVGEAMEILGINPEGLQSERELNEWGVNALPGKVA